MKKKKTLILQGKDVKRLLSMKEAMKEVEKAFKYFGMNKVQMPPKMYININRYKGDFRAMPSYIEGLNTCGIKWVNVHPLNAGKGLPTVMATIILADPSNGFPLCIMGATDITALRTGAAGGVAAKYMARRDSKSVALIGCGVQAATQLEALNVVFDLEKIDICSKKKNGSEKFKRSLDKKLRSKTTVFDSIRQCISGSDIIVTTTPSRRPIIKKEWLKEGVHINAIGADAKGKQELEGAILKSSKIVIDAWEQASHSGEINVPLMKKEITKKDIYSEIGEIAAGYKKGRSNKKEITVFDSTGLAIQDLVIANMIYKKALKRGMGKKMELI